MKNAIKYVVTMLVILFLCPMFVWAVDYMYWDSNFGPISLLSINSQAQTREGSVTVTLITTGDAEIFADNTASGPAELSCATDTLVTEYKLSFDGNGSGATGRAATSYETYDTFLSTSAFITYVTDDNDVDVTLWVRASNNPDEVSDSDTYNATQTLTVTWVGP